MDIHNAESATRSMRRAVSRNYRDGSCWRRGRATRGDVRVRALPVDLVLEAGRSDVVDVTLTPRDEALAAEIEPLAF